MSTIAQDRLRLSALEERLHRFYREHLLVPAQQRREQAEESPTGEQQQPQHADPPAQHRRAGR